jgi:hypothetical protein
MKMDNKMKNLTLLQILIVTTISIGSLDLKASSKNRNTRHQNPMLVMNKAEKESMKKIVKDAQERIEKSMGKKPTEHSIKKFIHSAVEEFKKSNQNATAADKAMFKLGDAKVAIKQFAHRLYSVDRHGIASTHIHSLKRKLENAYQYIREHEQKNFSENEDEIIMERKKNNTDNDEEDDMED